MVKVHLPNDKWRGEEVVGRPVDIATLPDGSMPVSDDFGRRIFRVTYDASEGKSVLGR